MKLVKLITAAMLLLVTCAALVNAGEGRFVSSRKTVEDKRTGLVWVRDANLGTFDWIGATEFVSELNKNEFAGFSDWRLPKKDELGTLVTYAVRAGYTGGDRDLAPYQLFNRQEYKEVRPFWYWTSEQCENNKSSAWVISMYYGTERGEIKDHTAGVWPVRGGK